MHVLDYLLLAVYLGLMLGVGAYFSRQQHTSADFFLAGRSMGWFPVGLSVMATLLSALSYSGVPGEAYWHGFKYLLLPLCVWAGAPLMWYFFLPLYRGLKMYSVYEYLELRYDSTTRLLSTMAFILWRLLWLGGVLYAPVKVLVIAAGLSIPEWVLLLALGLVGTGYTFLGGMKAVIWTDVIQAIVMVGGVLLIVGGVWLHLDGGATEVWSRAEKLGRGAIADPEFDWLDRWSIWGMAPHMVLSMMSFYIADQITVQRFLTARNVQQAKRSFLLNCLSVSLMIPALAYVGICLFAFYQARPEQMRPIWLANVRIEDQKSVVGEDGDPVLDWQDGRRLDGQVDQQFLAGLVERGQLLRPNSKEPFTDTQGLIDSGSGQMDRSRLAIRSREGEWMVNQRAKDELLPRFISDQLPIGVAGIILAALLAASMSSMDSGLNSISTLLITDVHRRMGFGRNWLAQRLGKTTEELNEADELRLARPLVLLIGVAATMFSLVIGRLGSIFDIMVGVVNTFGGPLLSIFLLGVFWPRATHRGAVVSLLAGTLYTIATMGANQDWPLLSACSGLLNAIGFVAVLASLGLAIALASFHLAARFRLVGASGKAFAGLAGFAGVVVVVVLLLWASGELAGPRNATQVVNAAAPTSVASLYAVNKVSSIWLVTFSVGVTVTLGVLVSLVSKQASPEQLRGLTVGAGELGKREPEMAHIALPEIQIPDE